MTENSSSCNPYTELLGPLDFHANLKRSSRKCSKSWLISNEMTHQHSVFKKNLLEICSIKRKLKLNSSTNMSHVFVSVAVSLCSLSLLLQHCWRSEAALQCEAPGSDIRECRTRIAKP